MISTLSLHQVEEAIINMFSVGCPKELGPSSSKKYLEDFEATGNSYEGEPFCGRKAYRNPSYLYRVTDDADRGIFASQYGKVGNSEISSFMNIVIKC